MSSVRPLYESIFEDSSQKKGSVPRGRKFAKKGPQGAWKALPDEMRSSYINDLDGYFDPKADETPEEFVERNSIVFEEGGDIHLVLVEPDSGTELESVWDDAGDRWDHKPAPLGPDEDPPDESQPSQPLEKPAQSAAAPPMESVRRWPGGNVRR